jgi:hypothetical protein
LSSDFEVQPIEVMLAFYVKMSLLLTGRYEKALVVEPGLYGFGDELLTKFHDTEQSMLTVRSGWRAYANASPERFDVVLCGSFI